MSLFPGFVSSVTKQPLGTCSFVPQTCTTRVCNVRLAKRVRPSTMPVMSQSDKNDGRADSGLFGIRLKTNGDVIKFGFAAIAFAYAFKMGVQALGTPDLLAGQITTGVLSVLSLLAWVSTYVFRVGTKGMTYAQQLREYEDQVIQKRYEELSEEELKALREEVDDDV